MEKREPCRQWKITPHIISGKGATYVPGTVYNSSNNKKETVYIIPPTAKKINGDPEGCRLD